MARGLFITGAGGYVGTRFVNRAGELPFAPVFTLLRKAARTETHPAVRVVTGDISDPRSWSDALAETDTIVHLAAITGKAPKDDYFTTNVEGTKRLLAAAKQRGVRRFIHISTIAVKFLDISHYHYARSKQQAEDAVRGSGLAFIILRPTLILGPSAPGLAGLSKLALAPVIPVFGDGSARLQPIHVDDLVQVLMDALLSEETGETIDAGGPERISMLDLLRRIRAAAGKGGAPVVRLPAAPFSLALAALEPFLLPLLPVTAGQLASFSNDGVADPNGWYAARQARMKSIDETLTEAFR